MELSEIKRIWENEAFRCRKKLGQNFLVDKNIINKIVAAVQIGKRGILVEIGAGFGVMTFPLAAKCAKLYAIEKDYRIASAMKGHFSEAGNIELIEGDILDIDLCGLMSKGEGLTVFGNIPYYITTPIITKLIEQKRCMSKVYLLVQREVAERMASRPGTKDYGSISCYVQYHAEIKNLFRVKKNSFFPPPKVESCFMEFSMREKPAVEVKDVELMFRIIHAAFSQRRKKAVNPLSHHKVGAMTRAGWIEVFERVGLDPSERAEGLALSDYAKLSDVVTERTGGSKKAGG